MFERTKDGMYAHKYATNSGQRQIGDWIYIFNAIHLNGIENCLIFESENCGVNIEKWTHTKKSEITVIQIDTFGFWIVQKITECLRFNTNGNRKLAKQNTKWPCIIYIPLGTLTFCSVGNSFHLFPSYVHRNVVRAHQLKYTINTFRFCSYEVHSCNHKRVGKRTNEFKDSNHGSFHSLLQCLLPPAKINYTYQILPPTGISINHTYVPTISNPNVML